MKRSVLFLVLLIITSSFAVAAQGEQYNECPGLEKEHHDNVSVSEVSQGLSDFEVETFNHRGEATVFTSPDSAMDSILYFLDGVNSSLDVAIYLFNHPDIARRIANLSHEGISVRVLIEGYPVNGLSEGSLSCLALINKRGGEVRTMGGDADDTYTYYHPKYMLRDNSSVMFTSENFVRPGFPEDKTYGNRGWGIILESEPLASYYREVYEYDWKLGETFHNSGFNLESVELESGLYSPQFNRTVISSGELKITPVLSPDTSMSEKTILDMIRSAEESIYVQQYYARHWENEKNPYLEVIKDAAERGVEVKIMLDSTWYHLGENGNDQMTDEINNFAEKEDVEMEARLLSSYKGLLKSHNKGMVVDGSQVLISSINWNANSVLHNREAGVIVGNDRIGDYYSEIFLEDWKDTIEPIADAGGDKTVTVGENATLSGENSWDDHALVSYRWDTNGDGIYDKRGKRITLTFEEVGEHRIELLAEDVGGNTDTDEIIIEVEKETNDFQEQYLNWIIMILPMAAITLLLLKSALFNRS